MPAAINEKGKRYGSLVVTGRAPSRAGAEWFCLCLECGQLTTKRGVHLREGKVKTCGQHRPSGEEHHNYSQVPTYSGMHLRLGQIERPPCNGCGSMEGLTWAFNHDTEDYLVDAYTGHRYSTNPEDYWSLCYSCHIRYDRDRIVRW